MRRNVFTSLFKSFRLPRDRRIIIFGLFSVATISFCLDAGAQDSSDAGKKSSIESSPVGRGGITLEEYKTSLVIELGVSQSRLFQIKNRIVRTSISEPLIAEPVVVSENQLLLLGKRPGTATLMMWDDIGNVENIALRVRTNCSPSESPVRAISDVLCHLLACDALARHIPSAPSGSLHLEKGETIIVGDGYTPAPEVAGLGRPDAVKVSVKVSSKQPYVYDILPPRSEPVLTMRFGLVDGVKAREHGNQDLVVDVEQSRAKTFKVNHRLVRFSVTDPGIAEPVVVSDTELVLLGKAPGKATVGLWDDAGNTVGIEVRVRRPGDAIQTIFRAFEEKIGSRIIRMKTSARIPPVVAGTMNLAEYKPNDGLTLAQLQAITFKMKERLIRTSISDPNVVTVFPNEGGMYLWGKAQGKATAFVWDDHGSVTGLALRVTGKRRQGGKAPLLLTEGRISGAPAPLNEQRHPSGDFARTLLPPFGRPVPVVELWTGSRKDLWEFPLSRSANTATLWRRRNPGQVHNLGGPGAPSEWHLTITDAQTFERSKVLSNEAVKAIADCKYELAITKLVRALYVDFSNQTASENLAVAYNNYGQSLRNTPGKAIEQFHQAIYVNPNDPTALENLEEIIRIMGKDPRNFQDRIALGDEASLSGDLTGAVIEYEFALQIKEDIRQRAKLGEVYKKLGEAQGKQSAHVISGPVLPD
jgi:Flp pilus assembly secretin CpaC